MPKQFKLTPQIKMRLVLILLFGAIVVSLIFAYGFFAMQKELWSSIKQCRESLNQIDQRINSLRNK